MAETNITHTPVVLQVPTTLKALIEALIFGAREPLSVRQIQALYEDQGTGVEAPRKVDYEDINRSVEELNGEFAASDRPYRIIQIAGGYQFATLPLYAEWLGKLYKEQTRRKLSQSSIETLAIIAYKQPITKPEIESIRGVNCDYVLSTLLEKDLATIVGRAPTVGRPLLYGTSTEFLRHFGLNDLNDLPRPREIQEILGDSQFETERRMLEAQQGAGEKKEEDFKSRLPHIPKRKSSLDNEVKILPKKRVRDIKVLPPEEAVPARPEAPDVHTPAEESTGGAPVVPVADERAEQIDDNGALDSKDFITADNVDPHPEGGLDEPIDQQKETEFTAPLRGIDRPTSMVETQVEGVTISGLTPPVASEELPTPAGDGIEGAEAAAAPSLEPPLVPADELHLTLSIPVEEIDLKLHTEKDLQANEETIVQVVPEPNLPALQQDQAIEVPQFVAPTIEDHDEIVTEEAPQVLTEEPSSDSSVPHPKTRWKSWKEKIQGFIKKLFG